MSRTRTNRSPQRSQNDTSKATPNPDLPSDKVGDDEEWDELSVLSFWKSKIWSVGALVALQIFLVCMLTQSLEIPEFSIFCLLVFIVLFIALDVLKHKGFGAAPVVLAIVIFEMIGLGRWIIGLRNIESLWYLMVFAGLFFAFTSHQLIRSSSTGDAAGRYSASSASTGFWTGSGAMW